MPSILQAVKTMLYAACAVAMLKILPLLKHLHLKRHGLEVDLDFVVEDKDVRDRFKWRGTDESSQKTSLPFTDFMYFIEKKLYLQVLLTKNDLVNFEHLGSIPAGKLEPVARCFYNKSYVFNVKFEYLSKIVEDYKKTEREVLGLK